MKCIDPLILLSVLGFTSLPIFAADKSPSGAADPIPFEDCLSSPQKFRLVNLRAEQLNAPAKIAFDRQFTIPAKEECSNRLTSKNIECAVCTSNGKPSSEQVIFTGEAKINAVGGAPLRPEDPNIRHINAGPSKISVSQTSRTLDLDYASAKYTLTCDYKIKESEQPPFTLIALCNALGGMKNGLLSDGIKIMSHRLPRREPGVFGAPVNFDPAASPVAK